MGEDRLVLGPGDVDGPCFIAGAVTKEESLQGGEEIWVKVGVYEDLVEIGCSAEAYNFYFFVGSPTDPFLKFGNKKVTLG